MTREGGGQGGRKVERLITRDMKAPESCPFEVEQMRLQTIHRVHTDQSSWIIFNPV